MRNNRIDRIISESIDRVLFESQGEINAYINYIQRPACIMIKLIDSYHPAANGCNNL